MSYSHTQRRKKIKNLKNLFNKDKWHPKWYPKFQEYVAECKKKMEGEPLGTLEEVMTNRGTDLS